MAENPFGSPPGEYNHRDAKAHAKAAKAYAKAQRPWYKKKRVLIPGGLVALGLFGAATGGSDTASTDPQVAAPAPAPGEVDAAPLAGTAPAPAAPNEPAEPAFTPTFPGQLETDILAAPGATTAVDDWEVTASPLERKTAEYLDGEFLCTDVTLVNKGDKTQDYNAGSFRLQDPAGGIQDYGTYYPDAESISFGSAAPGGAVTGTECFEARGEGQYVLFYQPNIYTGDGGRAAYVNPA
jgi:hypothetical protein